MLKYKITRPSLLEEASRVWERIFEENRKKEELSASQRKIELEAKISNLEDQENTLLDGYLQHIIEPEVYKKKKNEIFAKKLEFTDQKGKIGQDGCGKLEPLLEFMNVAKTGAEIARAKNNCHELAVQARNAGSNFFLDNRKLKPELEKGFDTLFFEGCQPTCASKLERISRWAGLSCPASYNLV